MNDHQRHHDHARRGGAAEGAEQRMLHGAAIEGEERTQAPHRAHAADEGHARHDHAAMVADFKRRFLICLVLTIPVLATAPMLQHWAGLRETLAFAGEGYVAFALSSVIFFYGGWPFLKGLADELRRLRPGMMTLIALAITVAYVYSSAVVFGLSGEPLFWELATLIDIMLLGHWIEMRSVMGASGALEALVKLLPSTAHRLRADGSLEDVPIDALRAGDRVLVKPGEKVPTDGAVEEGASSVDEAMLTGESRPVEKAAGAKAIGGSVNGEGALTLRIEKTGKDTYLSQVIDMVRQAQATRSRSQDLANRAALWLTIVALGAGGLTLAAWFAVGAGAAFAIERMVTVMVIACPHALGLAVPLVVAVSTSMTARSGLLIRDRAAFERARSLDAVIFDKTGTLTEGRFGVSDVIPLADLSEEDVLDMAAALERHSEHPIAKGIVRAAEERGVAHRAAAEFRTLPGQGAEAIVDGRRVRVLSPGALKAAGHAIEDQRVVAAQRAGKTAVFLLLDDRPVGAIASADVVRPESRQAVAELKAMGVQCMMLTGDARPVAESVAAELGLDEVFAEVLPHEKAAKVREVKAKGLRVAMVGDGVNDAPALVESDLGVAIGAGTDVAIQSADVVLVRSDPRAVAAVIRMARATYSKMVQNLLWATGYNAVAIPLAAGVAYAWGLLLSPAVGAVLMSLSTVIVAVNARLLGRKRRELAELGGATPSEA